MWFQERQKWHAVDLTDTWVWACQESLYCYLYVSYWCKSYLKGKRSYVSACIVATFIVALWKCNEAMCENLAMHFEEKPNDAIISIANYACGSAGSFPGFKPSHTLFLYLLSSLKLYTYLCLHYSFKRTLHHWYFRWFRSLQL